MRPYKWSLLLLAVFTISACDKKVETNTDNDIDQTVTETVLDDVDSIEGTISDAMINVEDLDESTDENDIESTDKDNSESEDISEDSTNEENSSK